MPAHSAGYMGIGQLLEKDVVFKRKFRWTLSLKPRCSKLSEIDVWFVKVASRPNISVDETELNFLNEKAWIPGKVSYETMTVTYVDVAPNRSESRALYQWLGAVYQFHNQNRKMGTRIDDYAARGQLTLFDGCGQPIERWDFDDLWPQAINFGDLDYTSSDTVDIELTLRYSRFTYTPICGKFDFNECCTPCA